MDDFKDRLKLSVVHLMKITVFDNVTGTPSPKARLTSEGFGGESSTIYFVNNTAKSTKHWRQLVLVAAASAICCTNTVKKA